MAAKSVALAFHTVGAFKPPLTIEPSWWPADELIRDRRFIMSDDTGSYRDWDCDVGIDELKVLLEHFHHLTETGLYALDGWRQRIAAQMQIINGALAGGLGTISHVHVTVFEWESGL